MIDSFIHSFTQQVYAGSQGQAGEKKSREGYHFIIAAGQTHKIISVICSMCKQNKITELILEGMQAGATLPNFVSKELSDDTTMELQAALKDTTHGKESSHVNRTS